MALAQELSTASRNVALGGAIRRSVRRIPVRAERRPALKRVVGFFEVGAAHGYVVGRFRPSANAQGVDLNISIIRETRRAVIAGCAEDGDALGGRLLIGGVEDRVDSGAANGFGFAVADADHARIRRACVNQVLQGNLAAEGERARRASDVFDGRAWRGR